MGVFKAGIETTTTSRHSGKGQPGYWYCIRAIGICSFTISTLLSLPTPFLPLSILFFLIRDSCHEVSEGCMLNPEPRSQGKFR